MTKFKTASIKRRTQVKTVEISLTSYYEEQIDLADDTYEPANVIGRKVDAIVELLGCTEEEAERIVLDHNP